MSNVSPTRTRTKQNRTNAGKYKLIHLENYNIIKNYMGNMQGSQIFFIVAFMAIKTELPDTTNLGKIQIQTI
jgi:hypothetical protein